MEHQSEERWCAGWLIDLHTALKGDKTYEWLVVQAGGYWKWPEKEVSDEETPCNINGRSLVWVPDTPGHKDPADA